MIDITFKADPLPSDFSGTLQDFQNRFLLNLRGSISDTQVLTGQVGGSKPVTNIGPWLNDQTWYVWNGSDYVPSTVKVGGTGYVVQLGSLTTVSDSLILPDFTQSLQDKDGIVALLDDIYIGRPVVVLSGTTPTIDWSASKHFTQILSGNTTYKMSNSQDGQEIVVAIVNSATSYSVSWPSFVFWPTSSPSQTANKTDLYIFYNIGGSIFGRQIANY